MWEIWPQSERLPWLVFAAPVGTGLLFFLFAGSNAGKDGKSGAKPAGAEPVSAPAQAAASSSEAANRTMAVQCGDAQALHLPAMER